MHRRRVVITGIGAITPIGLTRDGLMEGLRQERSAVGTITRFDPSIFRSHNAAEVNDFHPDDFLEHRRSKRLDRFGQFAVSAARMALEDSALNLNAEDRDRVGAVMGTALGGVGYAEAQLAIFLKEGLQGVDATLALAVFGGAASCNMAIEFGIYGPNSTNAMSCAAWTKCVAGQYASRPFDQDRDGFVMGEGATVLVLEERERAIARGAPIHAEVIGYGTTNDGHHMTAPRPDGLQAARCMRMALADADVNPTDVDYINAHGSSTPLNDSTETLAVRQVFAEHADRIPMSGTKGYYGHALGASGAFEAAICALALTHGWVPPTVNLQTSDAACDMDNVPGSGRSMPLRTILSNSFGFGGINASLVFRAAN